MRQNSSIEGTGYQLETWIIWVNFQAGLRDFPPPHRAQIGSGAQPVVHAVSTWHNNTAEHSNNTAEYSLQSGAKVKMQGAEPPLHRGSFVFTMLLLTILFLTQYEVLKGLLICSISVQTAYHNVTNIQLWWATGLLYSSVTEFDFFHCLSTNSQFYSEGRIKKMYKLI